MRPYISIFATPSMILRSSGSVGMSLVMWLLGATVAACGTAVFVELGTVCVSCPDYVRCASIDGVSTAQGLPRNGGEKNYLEFIYRRPRFLAITVYATFAILNVRQGSSCVSSCLHACWCSCDNP